MIVYLQIIAGFAFLIKGAQLLIDGGASIARKMKISDLVIGLTIIAFGTSAPELIINVLASWSGSTQIAIGNVIGSNIANILLILGLTAIIYPLRVKHDTIWKEIPLSILAVLTLGFMVNDKLIDGHAYSVMSRIDGLILLALFFIFLYHIHTMDKASRAEINKKELPKYSVPVALGLFAVGLLGLAIGGKLAVDGAVTLAGNLGVSQSLIGLTVIAIGTSLPELVTSVVAALRKNPDIAIGNVMGSNILNIFWVLGLSSVIHPIAFNLKNNMDIFILLMSTILLLIWVLSGRKNIMEKWQGAVFIVLYLCYITTLIIRG